MTDLASRKVRAMCRAKADGGQRCYAHTAKALTSAETSYRNAYKNAQSAQATGSPRAGAFQKMSVRAYERLLDARADYASTPQGEADLQARLAFLDEDSGHAGELRDAIRKGLLLRERNAAMKAAVKPKKSIPLAAGRPGPKKTAAAPIARSSAGEVTWVANTPTAEANRAGLTLLKGYRVDQEFLDMIPAGHEFEVYTYVEDGTRRDGAYRLIAEHGRGEGFRRYAQERIANWALTRTLNGNR